MSTASTSLFSLQHTAMKEILVHHTRGQEQVITAVPNLTLFRREVDDQPHSCLIEPSIAVVVEGVKRMVLGDETYLYDFHQFLITSLNLPGTVCTIGSTSHAPYLGFTLKLDFRLMAELLLDLPSLPTAPPPARGMLLCPTTPDLLDAFHRLLQLVDQPDAIAVVAPLIEREIYFRLLTGEQGAPLRQMAYAGSQSHRISRAIDWLRDNYRTPLQVETLASQVQMSTSNFHAHFRELTTMTPLQYQKWLRLNEARRLMLVEDLDAASAAFTVGYESASQFNREYSRQFGAPPIRDIKRLMQSAHV